jgi:hypothetical protein
MKKLKTILPVLAVLVAFSLVFALVQQLLQPKYMTDLVEGSMLSQYYGEDSGHDVIFIGDCEVYANFSPLELYREAGITAYVRGSSQQLLWQSFYVLSETLKYETPKAVVFNVNAMRHGEPVSEAFHRLTLDKMRWSKEKVDMIFASMTQEEDFLSYVFPILRYHSRFDELTAEDVQYLLRTKKNTWNGYLPNHNINPVGTLPTKRPLANYDFAQVCWDYLNRMAALCKEQNVELILIKAPSLYPYWYEQYDAQIQDFATENGLSYYDFTDCIDEIGLDFQVDTYDAGLHLNHTGSVKLSRFFARILAENHGMEDHSGDEVYDALLEEYDTAMERKETRP